MAILKKTFKKLINLLPVDHDTVVVKLRSIIVLTRKVRTRYQMIKTGASIPDPEKIYWIDPKKVLYYTNYCGELTRQECEAVMLKHIETQSFRDQVFDRVKDKAKAKSGNWDEPSLKFDDILIFKALRARIEEKKSWSETEFYANALRSINSGKFLWGCKNEEGLVNRCDFLDQLIGSMRENGFILNHEVFLEGEDRRSIAKDPVIGEEVLVNVGRNGEYLFQDGRHRLAIAKILPIEKIPVKILVRHSEWIKLRSTLSEMMKKDPHESRNAAAIHADISDIVPSEDSEQVFELIQPFLKTSGNNEMLDIGAKLGYFCHKFEKMGYVSFGIESNERLVRVANKLSVGEKNKFSVVCGDYLQMTEYVSSLSPSFNIVLALNTFPRLSSSLHDSALFGDWLKAINCIQLFFETSQDWEEIVDVILKHSLLRNYDVVHNYADDRRLIRLF